MEDEIKKRDDRIAKLRYALADMVNQFAYVSHGMRSTGGLSALELAFEALDLEDPHPISKYETCDEPGCKEEATCGWPADIGYRRTCAKHWTPHGYIKQG